MPRQLIFTFHGLGDPPHSITDSERRMWVPVGWFEAIVDALQDGVCVAFDDGNSSDVAYALPALQKRGVVARFFPLAGRIGMPGYLDAKDISTLSAAGMAIGSQGLHHRDWRKLKNRVLHDEITISRRTLSDIVGHEIVEAACPFGSYDRRVLRALQDAGYRRVFNSDGNTGSADSWLCPRTTVSSDRPLQHWLELAKMGSRTRPGPLPLTKRLIKRWR